MNRNRVVVTGFGIVAPSGIGNVNFWTSLLESESGIGHITLFDASRFRSRIAGEVSNFDLLEIHQPRSKVKRLARHAQLALAGARLAVDDARLDLENSTIENPVPVVVGVSTSAMEIVEQGMRQHGSRGPTRVPTHIVGSGMPQHVAIVISEELGFTTDAQTVSSACAAGLDAVGAVAATIAAGKSDIGIAGGSDAPISSAFFAFLDNAGLASRQNDDPRSASRPFDRDADSGVISEGAGMVVLENLEHALGRGAKPLLEIAGYGSRFDHDPEIPLSGLGDAMQMAMANAGCRPRDIDYICAHGPGHPVVDPAESKIIKKVFGEEAYRIPVSSIKGNIGNPLAAAGPMQMAACAYAMRDGLIPPTINLDNPHPECDLDIVRERPRIAKIKRALANIHGLGGSNASIIVQEVES